MRDGTSDLFHATVTEDGEMDLVAANGTWRAAEASPVLGGLATRFVARGAIKGRSARAHLNIEFESVLPADARGVFAELDGLQQMSDATKALLKRPVRLVGAQDAATNATYATGMARLI